MAELKKPALKDLAEYPIILPGLNTYTGRIIQNLFQKEGIPLKAPMSTNYLETISTMVEIGLGLECIAGDVGSGAACDAV